MLRDTFDNLLKAPTLILAHRTAFNDLDTITCLGAVLLVVDLVFNAALDIFVVDAVLNKTVNLYNNSFLHLVAYNNAHLSLSMTVFTHLDAPSALPSVRMVLILAISLRRFLSFDVFSSLPVWS
jgi:hypothetical protein